VLPPGSALGGEVLPFLKSRKMRKYMGKQDELAVIAAGEALRMSGIATPMLEADEAKTGVYLCVGYIPFERADIDALTSGSIRDGEFSMECFSTVGIEQVNPLLTFRCLPNMPIFHVSLNFGLRGPYFVTYPGIGQLYLALELAATALRSGEIDCTLTD
jgi:3-oxoacyl-(acyl-carrier-protein) synthase